MFARIVGEPRHRWDTSNLYRTGEVTLLGVPEPSSVAMMLWLLVAGVVALRRRVR